MSDFLFQLANRALARPPMVRPRLHSFYEPLIAPELGNPLEENIEVPAEPSRVVEPAREERQQADAHESGKTPAPKPIDRNFPAPREKARPELPAREGVWAKPDDPKSAFLPRRIEMAGTTARADLETTPPPARKHEHHTERVTHVRTEQTVTPVERARTNSADHSPEIELHAPSPATDLHLPAPATRSRGAEPRIGSPEVKPRGKQPSSKPTVVAVQPARRPREGVATPAWPPKAAPLAASPAAHAPSVHVAIGRVEIRAVLPPASEAQAGPAPARTRFSLDEYLKRNAGAAQ